MKKLPLILLFLLFAIRGYPQAPHLFEYDYPAITEEDPQIKEMLNQTNIDSLIKTINHLSSYFTRRCDSRYIYEVKDWLFNEYVRLGLDSICLHDFEINVHDITETAPNVIAIQKGLVYPDEYVVCGAHYDSYNNAAGHPDSLRSPGADDNATGVAGILETARILGKYSFKRSIIYCNFNAEEVGLVGSAAYAADCAADSMKIVGYFNMDMNGYLEEGYDIHVHLLYTTRDSLIADFFYNFCDIYYPDINICQAWLSGGDSDYSSFNRNGYPALFPCEDVHHYSPYIHTENDLMGLSVNNMEQSKLFTSLNIGAVATLAMPTKASITEITEETINIYPNPASDYFILNKDAKQLEIINLLGTCIQTESNINKNTQIDISHLKSGIYLLKIESDNKNTITKLIVK